MFYSRIPMKITIMHNFFKLNLRFCIRTSCAVAPVLPLGKQLLIITIFALYRGFILYRGLGVGGWNWKSSESCHKCIFKTCTTTFLLRSWRKTPPPCSEEFDVTLLTIRNYDVTSVQIRLFQQWNSHWSIKQVQVFILMKILLISRVKIH